MRNGNRVDKWIVLLKQEQLYVIDVFTIPVFDISNYLKV